ncbi:hypothetical protein CkaCkLH20_03641 [Colletotrichum karsti]|uniref:Uncharacterized protein n=1 Tax=Colletotrichum karsti TaxID=1095194 RepID=A0A9P6IBG8_9PEZI|nr:uncharacterized protein CkaCkLH20_03641 [Colletotrichum karsti]KAF9878741.1 hypothetical protein CkaCkLH20_03641 [Colletotrichum karsti]
MEHEQQHQQRRLLDTRHEQADDAVSPIEPDETTSIPTTQYGDTTSLEPGENVTHGDATDIRQGNPYGSDNIGVSGGESTRSTLRENSPPHSPSTSNQHQPDNDRDSQASATAPIGKNIEVTHFWWYWDFAGATVAVICMVLVAVTLSKADGIPLETWPLRISPNTIVAVLTTIARTALLVPLGSSISQLKWRHLILKARPLEHLQIFDGASRGPWGSTLMIQHLLFQSKLACALSLVTIITLGISPSTQQIIGYSELYRYLPHLDVAIGRADEYFSKGFRQFPYQSWQKRDANENLPAFQGQILQALAGSSPQPHFDCPTKANRCVWRDFSTLAVCRTFRNVTDLATRECDDPGSPLQVCKYTIPLGDDRPWEDDQYEISMMYVDHDAMESPRVSAVLNTTFLPSTQPDGWIGQLIVLRHQGKKWKEKNKWVSKSYPTTPEVFLTNFRWCQKIYRGLTATDGRIEISEENVTESFLKYGDTVDTDEHNPYDVNIFEASEGDSKYRLARTLTADLPTYLMNLLKSDYGERPGTRPTQETTTDSPMQMQHILYRADIANVTRNLEAVLTAQARSSNPGDNGNATVFTQGEAFGRATFIRVRWIWFAVPVTTVVLGLGLFVTTVIITRRTPLLKDSLLALLFYPLRGWNEDEVYADGPQTNEKLQKLAGSLYGRLETDEVRYRIVRDEGAAKD